MSEVRLSGSGAYELWRPILTAGRGLVAASVAVVAVLLHVTIGRLMIGLEFNDFGRFYYSALNAAAARSIYAWTPATPAPISPRAHVDLLNMNPPHFQAAIRPLALLPISTAYGVWVAINLAVAAWAIARIASALHTRPSLGWGLVALVAAPTVATTVTGQLTALLLGLTTWIWLDVRAGRWTRAGAAIGLAWSLKLFLMPLVLYLIARRRWRAAGVSVAIGGGCFVVGLGLYGISEHIAWIRALREASWAWEPMNASIIAPLARLTTRSALAEGLAPAAMRAADIPSVALSCTVLVVGFLAAVCDASIDRAMLMLLATCVLASPLGWVYYFWIFVGPLWACWADPMIRRAVFLTAPCWLAPFFVLWRFESAMSTVTIGSAYTWALLVTWLAILCSGVMDRRRRRECQNETRTRSTDPEAKRR